MTIGNKNPVPFKSKKRKVKKAWIDYNGHMNVAYYTLAFDNAIDEFLEKAVGIGPTYIGGAQQGSYALQTQYRYLKELFLGETFFVSIFVADFTPKRLHLMSQIIGWRPEKVFASCETIMVNVDLKKRQSCNYPKFARQKISDLYEASEELRLNTPIGQPIGLRKSV